MLVVKTSSATAGSIAPLGDGPANRPRKRDPSSRRRNPGSVIRVSAVNLPLRSRSWRFLRWRAGWRGCRRGRLQRDGWRGSRRRRDVRGLRTQTLFKHRLRRPRMGRHYLKYERQAEEDSAAPPANGGKEVSCLPNSDQRVWRRARPAEARGESTALSALKQNGEDQNDAVDDEQSEKKRVKH